MIKNLTEVAIINIRKALNPHKKDVFANLQSEKIVNSETIPP